MGFAKRNSVLAFDYPDCSVGGGYPPNTSHRMIWLGKPETDMKKPAHATPAFLNHNTEEF